MNTSVHEGNLSDRLANAKKESLELETLIKELEQKQQEQQNSWVRDNELGGQKTKHRRRNKRRTKRKRKMK